MKGLALIEDAVKRLGPVTARSLERATAMHQSTVRACLHQLVKDGHVQVTKQPTGPRRRLRPHYTWAVR